MEISLLIALVTAAITAFASYIVAVRKLSGSIKTSQAGELWAESKALRDDYRLRLLATEQLVNELRIRVSNLERENFDLRNAIKEQANGH